MFPKILQGKKVVDFSRLLPGPLASDILIKLGAEVVCIVPKEGDPILGNYSPFFNLREGKQFLELDLKNAQDLARAKKLISESHLLLEGFRPGAMDRLGLGFEEAKKLSKNLIYVSFNGYGPDHAKFKMGAHDLNFLIDSGVYSLIFSDDAKEIPLIQLADVVGGFYGAFLILASFIEQSHHPQAKHLRVIFVEALELLSRYLKDPSVLSLAHMLTGDVSRYRIYYSKDKKRIMVGAIEPKFYQQLLDTLGIKFEDSEEEPSRIAKIEEAFANKTLEEWEKLFCGVDACISFIPSRNEVLCS
ncbi:MAG: CoA transferase [Deltaproteobacteria bacterium]|nr:CoA transferase [Deltaproteobacteria bacterium]